MRRTILRGFIALLPLLSGCASAPPARLPEWDALPPGIAEAFCGKLRSEAVSSEAAIAVVETTEPLITAASLRALAQAYGSGGSVMPMSLDFSAPSLPVTLSSGSCNWKKITSAEIAKYSDEMTVQFSRPIVNPFGKSESGVFVRFSVGGGDPQWYWLPIAERQGRWLVGYISPLALRE